MNTLILGFPAVRIQTIRVIETAIAFLLICTFLDRSSFLFLKSIGQIISYPFLFISIICYRRRFFSLFIKDWFLLALTALAIASALWSVYPDTTIPNSRGLLRSTLFGIYLAMRFSLKDQLRLLAGLFSLVIIFSFFTSIAIPNIGIHDSGPHTGLWRGIFVHKNSLGGNMTISAQVFLLLGLYHKKGIRKFFFFIGFLLSIALVLLSRSTTALAALLSVTPLLIAYKILHQPRFKARILASSLVLLALILISFIVALLAEALLATQGKDLSFTGRTEVWEILIDDFLAKKPYLGYGYRAFWPEYGDGISFGGWLPGHAHNSFLELSLALGLIGVFIYLSSLLPTLFKAFSRMLSSNSVLDFWYLQFLLILLIIDSMGTSTVLDPVNLQWMFFVCLTFSLRIPRKRTKECKTV